jgi:hypothetical protein
LPTGWTHTGRTGGGGGGGGGGSNDSGEGFHVRHKGCNSIYSVPYSEHSSFTELIDFIRLFRCLLMSVACHVVISSFYSGRNG